MWETIFTQKRSYFSVVKSSFFSQSDKKINGMVVVKDEETQKFLREALLHFPVNILFVQELPEASTDAPNIHTIQKVSQDLYLGFDFICVDNEFEWLNAYFQAWVCPIIPHNHHLSLLLKEFDPLKSEGNSYIYTENNKWSMLYAMIRYMENYKFPYDNRNLIKNITSL